MTIAHSTGRARSGEVSIFFQKAGKSGHSPILIVHGLSYFSWTGWKSARCWPPDREVVAMDMRGFGDSDWSPTKDYSVPSMARTSSMCSITSAGSARCSSPLDGRTQHHVRRR